MDNQQLIDKLTKTKNGYEYNSYLDLRGTAITALPDNLTVGGGLYLRGTAITALPDNLTVGGGLYLEDTAITDKTYKPLPDNYIFYWLDKKYIKADGIFAKIISTKKNVYKLRKIASKDIFYLFVGETGICSHGKTLKEAREDLIFKICNRNKSDYANLKLSDKLTFNDAIICYRVITGACSFGTKDFISNRLKSKKKNYSIADIIKLTTGEYGNKTFSEFFSRGSK